MKYMFLFLIIFLLSFNLYSNNQNNELFDAINSKKVFQVKKVIKKRININSLNSEGKTPLIIAIENNYEAIAELLLEYNPNINIKDNNGKSALDYSKLNQNVYLEDLLEKYHTMYNTNIINDYNLIGKIRFSFEEGVMI